MGDLLDAKASFHTMSESTKADWEIITTRYVPFARELPDRILAHLRLLGGDSGGFAVDRLQHSLLTATLAHRNGEDEETVVCALLHDIGDTLGSWNHPDVSASILKAFVSAENHWMVEKHGIFQGYNFFHHIGLDRNMREQFRGHTCFERTARFVDLYDNRAFDPHVDCAPLEFFEPMVRRLFAQPKNSIYKDTCPM
ncbi:MAG: HD domain-containing protein [Betaproteobacteria bacterium]|jgi:predicted HD phosphohydrolase|nr:HD domain-containing protein [Rhodocyclaceae bacterium]MCA3133223.1 HD domain-containing protein [Rhodocyclaceae bacterium]MCA3140634.1 HD domain-containing protein [Rhodocyclaceae bacterium]MCA3144221.1 HD domain-containing protein [Rhodocyclaceae bacterium]MCE2897862.1 HD domain-containing protein [Betaproteobacteria bacterium]